MQTTQEYNDRRSRWADAALRLPHHPGMAHRMKNPGGNRTYSFLGAGLEAMNAENDGDEVIAEHYALHSDLIEHIYELDSQEFRVEKLNEIVRQADYSITVPNEQQDDTARERPAGRTGMKTEWRVKEGTKGNFSIQVDVKHENPPGPEYQWGGQISVNSMGQYLMTEMALIEVDGRKNSTGRPTVDRVMKDPGVFPRDIRGDIERMAEACAERTRTMEQEKTLRAEREEAGRQQCLEITKEMEELTRAGPQEIRG